MKNKERIKKLCVTVGAALLWITVWQIAAAILDRGILLASPVQVLSRLRILCVDGGFWATVLYSFSRIVGGFLCGLLLGSLLAVIAGRFRTVEILLSPLMLTVRTVPVASFVVLALMWLSSARLSVFISFLMVLPIIYTNLLDGLHSTDPKMQETAALFRLSASKRLKYVTLPQIKPFLLAACRISLGLAWKSGVAAEVIGLPDGSIGERLYESKIYYETADLFAWTLVIVLISILFERLFLRLLRLTFSGLERAV